MTDKKLEDFIRQNTPAAPEAPRNEAIQIYSRIYAAPSWWKCLGFVMLPVAASLAILLGIQNYQTKKNAQELAQMQSWMEEISDGLVLSDSIDYLE